MDALDGKIDLIVTKSVSRFARNTVDRGGLFPEREYSHAGFQGRAAHHHHSSLAQEDGHFRLPAPTSVLSSRTITSEVFGRDRSPAGAGR